MAILKHVTKKVKWKIPKAGTEDFALGCDPEFFITRKSDGKVVGSELLIDKPLCPSSWGGTVIVDGVQAEINPTPDKCRANLANSIISCFKALREKMHKSGKFSTSFDATVEISKQELEKLNEESRKFGCAPSLNTYTGTMSVIPYKGDEYLKRSAGGHIHIGTGKLDPTRDGDYILRITYMMDILVGIPSVLLDRDPGNIERRKVYGRAGEYRLPEHGYEYRTLSNYWLRGYPIMSLVFGLTKYACWVARNHTNGMFEYIMETTKEHGGLDAVQKAINENDFNLAYRLFSSIEPGLRQSLDYTDASIGLSQNSFELFHYLVWKGIDHFFPKTQDFVKYWSSLPEAHDGGIYDFWYGGGKTLSCFKKDKGRIIDDMLKALLPNRF